MEHSRTSWRVALGVDHGGWALKRIVADEIARLGHQPLDCGADRLIGDDDYPDYAAAVGEALSAGRADRGVLICGSGVGVVLAANRVVGVRACLCHDTYSAAQGVNDDDMNVLCLGARVIGPETARLCVAAFLAARFQSEQIRFVRRLNKVKALEAAPGIRKGGPA